MLHNEQQTFIISTTIEVVISKAHVLEYEKLSSQLSSVQLPVLRDVSRCMTATSALMQHCCLGGCKERPSTS